MAGTIGIAGVVLDLGEPASASCTPSGALRGRHLVRLVPMARPSRRGPRTPVMTSRWRRRPSRVRRPPSGTPCRAEERGDQTAVRMGDEHVPAPLTESTEDIVEVADVVDRACAAGWPAWAADAVFATRVGPVVMRSTLAVTGEGGEHRHRRCDRGLRARRPRRRRVCRGPGRPGARTCCQSSAPLPLPETTAPVVGEPVAATFGEQLSAATDFESARTPRPPPASRCRAAAPPSWTPSLVVLHAVPPPRPRRHHEEPPCVMRLGPRRERGHC